MDRVVAEPSRDGAVRRERASGRTRGVGMLTLLDLRELRKRLGPNKLEIDPATAETVREILQRVFVEGDEVLVALAADFDRADLSDTGILVDDEAFSRAERDTPDDLKKALDDLIDRLRDLAERQTPREWWHERDGVRFGEIVRPLRTIGCYVPGGRARYPSTVAMTVVPAVVAGVEEIVVCTPPQKDGSVPAPVLYAARRAGATYVARTGGAQAVAAMAYGTESIPAVDRIVGPGNVYGTEAKRQGAGFVGIDGLAGPSELAIVADGDVDPRMAALDLIAQAEHDPHACTYFLTPDQALIENINASFEQELPQADRAQIVEKAIRYPKFILVRDLDHVIESPPRSRGRG